MYKKAKNFITEHLTCILSIAFQAQKVRIVLKNQKWKNLPKIY